MEVRVPIEFAVSCGGGAVDYIENFKCGNTITIWQSEGYCADDIKERTDSILESKKENHCDYELGSGSESESELMGGIALMRHEKVDTVIAIGDEFVLNRAKCMLCMYEYPEIMTANRTKCTLRGKHPSLKTKLVLIPTNAGMAKGVSRTSTITLSLA